MGVFVRIQLENQSKNKHVEDIRDHCLDEGSNPSDSTKRKSLGSFVRAFFLFFILLLILNLYRLFLFQSENENENERKSRFEASTTCCHVVPTGESIETTAVPFPSPLLHKRKKKRSKMNLSFFVFNSDVRWFGF